MISSFRGILFLSPYDAIISPAIHRCRRQDRRTIHLEAYRLAFGDVRGAFGHVYGFRFPAFSDRWRADGADFSRFRVLPAVRYADGEIRLPRPFLSLPSKSVRMGTARACIEYADGGDEASWISRGRISQRVARDYRGKTQGPRRRS